MCASIHTLECNLPPEVTRPSSGSVYRTYLLFRVNWTSTHAADLGVAQRVFAPWHPLITSFFSFFVCVFVLNPEIAPRGLRAPPPRGSWIQDPRTKLIPVDRIRIVQCRVLSQLPYECFQLISSLKGDPSAERCLCVVFDMGNHRETKWETKEQSLSAIPFLSEPVRTFLLCCAAGFFS